MEGVCVVRLCRPLTATMRACVPYLVSGKKDEKYLTFIPTADVVRVDAQGRLFGQNVINTIWFKFRAGAPTLEDLITLGEAFNTYWGTNQVNSVSQDYSYNGCLVTDQSSESAPGIAAPITSVNGGEVQDSEPGSVCVCITFLTGGRGRSGRGRNYVSGVPVGFRTGNQFNQDFADSLVNDYNALLADPIDTDWEWSVVSHFTGGNARPAGVAQPVIGARVADLNIDSQRRRLAGRGT